MEVFQCIILNFSFCIIMSHKWFTVRRVCLLASMILDVKDKSFCSLVFSAVSALITEITVGFKLPDGIKWASFLCFQSSIWEVFVGAGHTLTLFLSLHWGCVYVCYPCPWESHPESPSLKYLYIMFNMADLAWELRQMSMLTGSRCVVIKTEVCICDLSHLGTCVCFTKPKLFFNSKSSFF